MFSVNLNKIFTNPACGLKGSLWVEYFTRGFSGSIRVKVVNDTLVATIELGYPPLPPVEEEREEVAH